MPALGIDSFPGKRFKIPLSKFGGVYGKTGEEPAGEVKNDDGIVRSLSLTYETLKNGAYNARGGGGIMLSEVIRF